MGAKVIIFDKILNSTFLKGLRHSGMAHSDWEEKEGGTVLFWFERHENPMFRIEMFCITNLPRRNVQWPEI